MIDLEALAAAPAGTDPFPHVVVPRFVPPPALAAIRTDIPPIEARGSFPPPSLRLGPAARALVEALEGPAFRSIIATKFGLDLDDAPTMLTIRGRTTARDGRIHRDSDAKRVTILLYLNPADCRFTKSQGCLRLLRGPADLEDYAVEVSPLDGTLLVFPNAANAWHGHHRFVGPRVTIQLNYMTTDGRARAELRRHRFSAFVKRLAA